jgi:hypothetical protein
MPELKCPDIESSEYLCDRPAEYQVDGTIYCNRHARRLVELKDRRAWESEQHELAVRRADNIR